MRPTLHNPLSFIIYYLFFILYYFIVSAPPAAAQTQMRDVFAAMPDSVAPLVSRNNRLDCIDFIENGMEARVRNVLDDYVVLEALTPDYARFRTSPSALLELKLLPLGTSDTTFVLCLVRTAQTGEPGSPLRLETSTLRLLLPDWSPLPDSLSSFSLPAPSAFVDSPSIPSDTLSRALRSLASFPPVRLALSPDAATLTATLQPAFLAVDEREAIAPRLRPLTFVWDGHTFVRQEPPGIASE